MNRGTVSLKARVRGDVDITLDRLDPGDLFGEAAFLTGSVHIESALAESDVRLFEISSRTYDFLRSAQPGVAHRLAQVLIRHSAARLRNMLCRVQGFITA